LLTERIGRHEAAIVTSLMAVGLLVRVTIAHPWAPGPAFTAHLVGHQDQCWYPGFQLAADLAWYVVGGDVAGYVLLHVIVMMLGSAASWPLSAELGFSAHKRVVAVGALTFLPYYVSVAARQPQVGWCIATGIVATWLLVRWHNRGYRWRDGLLFGFATIISCLFRPTMLFGLVAALVLLVAWSRRSRVPVAVVATVSALGLAALHAARIPMAAMNPAGNPRWSMYCSDYLTAFPPLSGYNLYVSNSPFTIPFVLQHRNGSMEAWTLERHPLPVNAEGQALDFHDSAELTRITVDWMRQHPWVSLAGFIMKALKFWEPVLADAAVRPLSENAVYSIPYAIYLPLAMLGAYRALRRRDLRNTLLTALVIGFFLPHILFFGVTRMRMSIEFCLVLLAVRAVTDESVRGRKPRAHRRGTNQETWL
jgi:hypothetical protein